LQHYYLERVMHPTLLSNWYAKFCIRMGAGISPLGRPTPLTTNQICLHNWHSNEQCSQTLSTKEELNVHTCWPSTPLIPIPMSASW
jgi:hypothetical protein